MHKNRHINAVLHISNPWKLKKNEKGGGDAVSCPQAPVILKAKFSSSITSGGKNRAWQEIANIVNAGNSVKRDIKEIQKNGTIYVLPQQLRFLYIVGAKDKQVIDNSYIKKK